MQFQYPKGHKQIKPDGNAWFPGGQFRGPYASPETTRPATSSRPSRNPLVSGSRFVQMALSALVAGGRR